MSQAAEHSLIPNRKSLEDTNIATSQLFTLSFHFRTTLSLTEK